MGRINLTALRVQKRALADLETRNTSRPKWLDIVTELPPAQVLTRHQPIRHELTHTRARILPNGKFQQYIQPVTTKHKKSLKPSRLFSPAKIRYEEDALRKRFFSDHPWELARPRVVLETSGDQHQDADWSTGVQQSGMPLSGECVVQRQLWLLENIPDISVPEAYDVARKEFYTLRRQEETRRRVAAEEAEAMGAEFGRPALQWGMQMENKMYDSWEAWSRQQVMENEQRNAAFGGTTMQAEEQALKETQAVEQVNSPVSPRPTIVGRGPASSSEPGSGQQVGKNVFAYERQRMNRRVGSVI